MACLIGIPEVLAVLTNRDEHDVGEVQLKC